MRNSELFGWRQSIPLFLLLLAFDVDPLNKYSLYRILFFIYLYFSLFNSLSLIFFSLFLSFSLNYLSICWSSRFAFLMNNRKYVPHWWAQWTLNIHWIIPHFTCSDFKPIFYPISFFKKNENLIFVTLNICWKVKIDRNWMQIASF